jgi:hypothetical protein
MQGGARRVWPVAVVALLVVLLGLALSTAAGAEPDPLCVARDEVQAAVDQLQDVDVIQEGTPALRAALERLRRALTAFADAARAVTAFTDAARAQGEEVRAAAARLRMASDAVPATIRDSEGQPLVERARAISDALALVVNLTGQLLQAVAPVCP